MALPSRDGDSPEGAGLVWALVLRWVRGGELDIGHVKSGVPSRQASGEFSRGVQAGHKVPETKGERD